MSKETENVSERELFSELFENPIHPLQIHMVPSICWWKFTDVIPATNWRRSVEIERSLWEAEDSVWSTQLTGLVNDSMNQLGSVLGKQSKKAVDDFGVRCKTRHLSRDWRWSKSSTCFEWTDAGEWSFYSNKWPDKEMPPDPKAPIVFNPTTKHILKLV